MTLIGRSLPRIDARDKVLGSAEYSGDLSMKGMLFMKILFAERTRDHVKGSKSGRAEAADGVVAVYTAKDVLVNEYGLQIPDQPVLCGPGSAKPYTDIVRFVGDQVAVVVANSEASAEAALHLIEVEYEDLPILADSIEAMRSGAILFHPDLGDSNVCVHYKIRKGDVEAGFGSEDVLVEGEYRPPITEHAFLQPEAGLSYMDEEGRITIACGGQGTHADREAIAHTLNLPTERVRVIYPAIGGAFGGREDLSVQAVLALATWKLQRPVKIIWSRRESMIGHAKRHAVILRAKWGATRDGMLVAAENEIIGDGGAYMYTSNKVLGNSAITSTGPYFIPNVKTDVYGVYTNNVPGAAFRGFGAPQALFMAEMQMNKLAEKLGMNPVEIRLKNALKDGDTMGVGTSSPSPVTVTKCIEAAVKRFEWANSNPKTGSASHLKRGKGFAAGFKNIGFSFGYQENCWAKVEIHGNGEIEKVVLHHAGAEVGQGVHTVMMQMAAEAVGVSFEKVKLIASDSATMANSASVSPSPMPF